MGAITNIAGLASTGAGLGTALGGPAGTVAGAVAGAVVGIGQSLYDYFVSNGDDPATAAAKAHQYDSTFVATPAQLASTNYAPALANGQVQEAAGFDASTATGGRQGSLADTLQARANGQGGPSIAELQLQQKTDANARAAASLIASQRGINPGLAARLAGRAETDANQQAVGQAAILRAQEQQAAQAQLANVLGQQRAGDIAGGQLGESLFGTAGGLTGQQRGQDLQNQISTNEINAATASGNATRAANVAAGTRTADQTDAALQARQAAALASGAGATGAVASTQPGGASLPSPDSTDNTPESPGFVPQPVGAAHGGVIPGRAPVAGDSPANDLVHALLSPGEAVVPRSIMDADDAPERAAEFVAALLRHKRGNGARRAA